MKKTMLILSAFLLLCFTAQGRAAESSSGRSGGVFSGISGGMMLHGGYLFSQTPEKVFSNSGLGSLDYVKGLPKDGFCYGLGGTIRVHLIDHIHLGAEGFVSNLPLMKTGSNIRSGWGGAMCDFYTQWGKTRPIIGLTVGGGTMKRLYVPDQDPVKEGTGEDATTYNSSYVKTPFFLLDPYVGMEIDLTDHMALILRIDYMLPIGKTNSSLVETAKSLSWNSFMTPSGPRLYVGLMFGKFGN